MQYPEYATTQYIPRIRGGDILRYINAFVVFNYDMSVRTLPNSGSNFNIMPKMPEHQYNHPCHNTKVVISFYGKY